MSGADETLDRLAQEYVRRLRDGEAVEVDEYADAHPALAERIHELFPVLVLMEGLKPPTRVGAAPAPAPAAEADAPTRIGPYTVVRELGRGGMGRVYEVHGSEARRLALKVVHPHLLDRPGFLARFLREVETGLRIDHPGVVTTIESGVAEYEGQEVPYLVLEYVEGSSLRSVLDETGGVSERLAREIGIAVADALAAIHAAGIVHRDVKPENVVIAPDETVKVMDLGVALVQEEALRLTQTGEFVGSLLYASPEQLRSGRVDARSDLYALGLLLQELLVGRHPEAEGAGAMLTRRFSDTPLPRLREVVPSTTPFFEAVVSSLLASDPARRFPSAEALVEVLREGERSAWWTEHEAVQARPLRPLTPEGAPGFVGRAEDLRVLDAAYASVRGGEGRVLVVVGEAGVGKSRLAATWLDARERDAQPPAVAWLEHGPGAGVLGLAPLAHAVARLLGDRVEAAIRTALGDQAEAAKALLAHVRAPDAADDGPAIGRTALEGLYRMLLRSIAAERPLVLVVEDLHFAPAEVRAWLDRLVPGVANDPILLLATSRPDVRDDWIEALTAAEHARVHRLAGLGAEDGAALFAAALGAELGELAAAQDVVRSADGNPFCLIEFAGELRAHARRDDRPAGDAPHLPDSVQRLVEERLATLSEDERDLLSVAACCGDRFDPVLVCEAAGVPRIAGLRTLHRADREHRVIAEEGTTYRFRHHLVQEGMHGSLPPALRAAYHTSLAAAREARLAGDGAPPDAEAYAIARHYLLGDQPRRAAPFVQAGLEHLLAVGEHRRAARMARRALESLGDGLQPAMRARLLSARAQALDGRVDPEVVLGLAQEALAEAERADDDRLLVMSIQGVGSALARAGLHPKAWPYAERAAAIAERIGDPRLLALTLSDLASCVHDAGREAESIAIRDRAIRYAREAGDAVMAGRAIMTQAAYHSESGRLDEARRSAEIALSTAHLHGDRKTEGFALGVLGRMTHLQGDLQGALALAKRQEAMAREDGNIRAVAGTHLSSAHIALNLGDLEGAGELARLATEVFRASGFREMGILIRVPLTLLYTLTGDFAAAYSTVQESLALVEEVPLAAVRARVPPRIATLLAWMGDHESAAPWIEQGNAWAGEAGVVREQFLVDQAAAGLPDARGQSERSADAYRRLLVQQQDGPMPLYVAMLASRLGGLAAELGDSDEARGVLDRALAIAEPAGLRSVAAEARIWRDMLPGGRPDAARVLLEREGPWLSAVGRIRMTLRLAERMGDEALRGEARALCEQLIASAPEPFRARMRADVPLYREVLA